MSYKIRGDKEDNKYRIARCLYQSDSIAVLIKRQAWLDILEPCEVYVVQHFSAYPALIAEYFKWKAYWSGEKGDPKLVAGAEQVTDVYTAAAIYYATLAGESDPRAWLLDGQWESGYWWLIQAAPRHTWPDWFAKEYRQHEEMRRVQSCRGVEISKTIHECLEMGLTDHEIADELGLYAKTVTAVRQEYEDELNRSLPMHALIQPGLTAEDIAAIINFPIEQIEPQQS